MPDYQLLGLGNIASVITKVEVNSWGNELCVSGLCDPLGHGQAYRLIFSNAKEIKWLVHDSDDLEEATVDFIGFIIGENNHRQPAIITTTVFEIFVLYESLAIDVGWETREISRVS